MKLEATNPARGRSGSVSGSQPDSQASAEYTITSAPEAHSADMSRRRRRYLIQMGIRIVCVILLFFVPRGWPMILVGVAAVVLPYIAVVGANAGVEMSTPGEMAEFEHYALGPAPSAEQPAAGSEESEASSSPEAQEPVIIVQDPLFGLFGRIPERTAALMPLNLMDLLPPQEPRASSSQPGSSAAPPSEGSAEGPVCSRKGCRQAAAFHLVWNNPRLHTPERRKIWAACPEHLEYLKAFLSERSFLKEVTPL